MLLLQVSPGIEVEAQRLQTQLQTAPMPMQTEDPWQLGPHPIMPVPALGHPRTSSDIVPSEIFGVSDMSLGTLDERGSGVPVTAALWRPDDVYQSRQLQQGSASQHPILQGYPVSGQSAPFRRGSPATSQQPSRALDLLSEHLQAGSGRTTLQGLEARQPFTSSARRSTPSLPGSDTHDGSSSAGSRNSPQIPPLRPQIGAPAGTARGSPAVLRGRSYSTSALPRGSSSLVSYCCRCSLFSKQDHPIAELPFEQHAMYCCQYAQPCNLHVQICCGHAGTVTKRI